MPTYTTKATDSFDRADGALPGSSLDNANGGTESNTWTEVGTTGWVVSSNKAFKTFGPAGTTIVAASSTPTTAHKVSAAYNYGGTFGSAGVLAMYDVATGKNYNFYRGSSSSAIFYFDGGAFNTVASGGPVIADASVMLLDCTAGAQAASVDGTVVMNGTNGALSSGVFGMYSEGASGFDNIKYEVVAAALTPTQLIITTQPVGNQSGVNFTTQPVVAVRDVSNTTVTTDTSTVVATLNTLSGSGTLGGTTSVAAVSGVSTFTNLKITGTGSFTITFSDGALTTATTGTIWVGAAAVHITSQATTAYTQRTHGNVVVAVRDGGGTTVGNATNSITIALTVLSGSAVLTSGTTTQSASSGVVTYSNLLVTCTDGATWTYAVSASGLTGDTSSPLTGTVRSLDVTDTNT